MKSFKCSVCQGDGYTMGGNCQNCGGTGRNPYNSQTFLISGIFIVAFLIFIFCIV